MIEPLRLLHLTDPHLHAHRDAMMRGVNTFESFSALIEHVAGGNRRPDAILATGDLVQDETRQGYERFRDAVSKLDAPVHCIPGNHDSPRIMAELLSTPPFQYCGTQTYGNWQLIMLNSATERDDGGRLDAVQLENLRSALRDHPDSYALIALHHHPLPTGSRWLDGLGLRNSDELLSVVEEYPNARCVAWGHVHQASERVHGKALMLSTPSTGSQFLPDSEVFMMDSRPPGYRWINLHPDGSIETEVVWLS